jgi:hypothetical protein
MSGVRENNHDPLLTPTLGKVAELPSYRFRMMRRTGSSIASTSPLVHCVRAHALSVVTIGRADAAAASVPDPPNRATAYKKCSFI